MWTIKQPPKIIFGKNSVNEFSFPEKCLVITSKGANSRGWLQYSGLANQIIFDNVESNPSIETTEKIISEFQNSDFSHIIGIGGGSSMDVAKYCAFKMNKLKIMIPTTFGSGSEVTRISVLKIEGKKKSFHDDKLIADVAIVDSSFLDKTPMILAKNSIVDACAQSSEAYDSKNSNMYTQYFCKKGFNYLEEGIFSKNNDKIALGSLFTGLGFGNSSTTLGHALSYVYSNEGYFHGHALAFTTLFAHTFNNSQFKIRFKKIVDFFGFEKIYLKQDLSDAAKIILTDRKHLDNNPKSVSEKDIVNILNQIQTI